MAKYQFIFEEFKTMFPYISERVIEWYMSGELEITVTLDDKSKIVYDHITKSIQRISSQQELNDREWNREFSRRLERKLYLKGMSQQELSDKTGISRQMLSKYINGLAIPSIINIRQIAKVIGVSVSYLTDFD